MPTKKQILTACKGTELPSLHIAPAPGQAPGPMDSKFGGECYLPAGAEAPEMEFLAQINFAQAPHLEGFPDKGLLQFFLKTAGDGPESFEEDEDEDILQTGSGAFQIRWYPDTEDSGTSGLSYTPVEETATLSLTEDGLLVDLGFDSVLEPLTQVFMKKSRGYDLSDCGDTDQFCRDFGNWGFKLGGHPALRQGEFRLDDEAFQAYTVLLFQYDLTVPDPKDPMDLEKDTFCFFIKPEDLKACRFDDILMVHHNCY